MIVLLQSWILPTLKLYFSEIIVLEFIIFLSNIRGNWTNPLFQCKESEYLSHFEELPK